MTLREEQQPPQPTDNQSFFDALGRAEAPAIRQLAAKITFGVQQAAAQAGLAPQDAEETLNDAVVITISNIRDGKFQFRDFSPATYATGVARKLIANRMRVKKPAAQEIENLPLLSDLTRSIPAKQRAAKSGRRIANTAGRDLPPTDKTEIFRHPPGRGDRFEATDAVYLRQFVEK